MSDPKPVEIVTRSWTSRVEVRTETPISEVWMRQGPVGNIGVHGPTGDTVIPDPVGVSVSVIRS